MKRSWFAILVSLGCGYAVSFSFAAGKVISVEGEVTLTVQGSQTQTPLKYDDSVQQGDTITTGKDGKVKLYYRDDNSLITIEPASQLIITKQLFDAKLKQRETILQLLNGKVRALVPKIRTLLKSSYEVATPNAVAGVRGTDFLVSYDAARGATGMLTFEGLVGARLLDGTPLAEIPANHALQVEPSATGGTEAPAAGSGDVKAVDPAELQRLDRETTMVEEPPPPTMGQGGYIAPPPWLNPQGVMPLPPRPQGPPPLGQQFLQGNPLGPTNGPPPIDLPSAAGSDLITPVQIQVDTSNLPTPAN